MDKGKLERHANWSRGQKKSRVKFFSVSRFLVSAVPLLCVLLPSQHSSIFNSPLRILSFNVWSSKQFSLSGVRDDKGADHPYDFLVFCTGSRYEAGSEFAEADRRWAHQ